MALEHAVAANQRMDLRRANQIGARAMLLKAFTIMSSNDLPAPLSLFDHIWCQFFDDPMRRHEPAHEAGRLAPF
jgi:hypothetical protein